MLALAGAVGAVLGLGLFTFRYAEGLSYFSTDPRACANCHIMNDAVRRLAEGPAPRRRHAASTATCRTTSSASTSPRRENGYHHSQGLHAPGLPRADPDQAAATPRSSRQNCLRCHGDFVHEHRRRQHDRARRRPLRPLPPRRRARRAALTGETAMTETTSDRAPTCCASRGGRRRVVALASPRAGVAALLRQHLRAQAGGAEPVRAAGRGHRGDDRPGAVGHELAAPVRRATSAPPTRRARASAASRGAARGEDRARPVAQAHVRRLRVRDRLPRPPRPRLHALRPGADQARDRSRSRARACTATRRSSRPTAGSATAT